LIAPNDQHTGTHRLAATAHTSVALSDRQRMVLRAVVTAYVADAAPASSATVSHLLPVALSSASIRNTMSELASLGLIEKPHASAGRIPTDRGLRQFLDHCLAPTDLNDYERRTLESSFDAAPDDAVMELASQLLSERTHQLGFALAPRIERIVLRHVSLVRVARDRILVVLVPQFGPTQQRVVDEAGGDDQAELDQMAAALNERISGRTLVEVRAVLETELGALRSEARGMVPRSLRLGLRALGQAFQSVSDLVITSRVALLSQPEFNDPDRIRGIFAAVETQERLIEILAQLLEGPEEAISVALGEDLAEPGLRECALVAVPYAVRTGQSESGAHESSDVLGMVGVLGPTRMDYGRIIPLVSYCSRLVSRKLGS
jgi:heat-inducible transcriptional repressor